MNGWILRAGTKIPGAHRAPVSAVVRLRRLAAAIVVGALALLGLHVVPAQAAGVGSIAKALDPVQGGGFTAPNTFQTGALVRYSLSISCSSNTTDCGIGKITDVLDPNLEYVGIVQPTQTAPVIPVSASASGQTVTINVGSAATPWPDGNKLDITLIVRVRASATGSIDNQASLTTNGGTSQSQIVTINTPPATPKWSLQKGAGPTSIAPGETTTYVIKFAEPSKYGNVDITRSTVTDTLPPGTVVVNAAGGTVGTDAAGNTTITWTTGALSSSTNVNCDAQGNNCTTYWIVSPTIRFPNPPYVGGEKPVNKVSADVTYSDGSSATLSASATISVVAPQIAGRAAKSGPSAVMPGEVVRYAVQGFNWSNVTVNNWTVTDTLPTNLPGPWTIYTNYAGVYQPQTYGPYTTITFEYQDAAGTWQPLYVFTPNSTTNPTNKMPDQILPTGALAWRMTAAALPPGSYMYVNLRTTAPTDIAVGTTFRNCAVETGIGLTPTLSPTSCVDTTIVAPYSQLGIYKHASLPDAGTTSIKPGDTVWFSIGIHKLAGAPLTSADITDLMPSAFTYLPGTACSFGAVGSGGTPDSTWFSQYYYNNYCKASPLADPVITPGVPAGGTTTLLQWLDLPMPSTVADGSHYYTIYFQAQANPGTAIANYTNTAYTNTTVPGVTTTCSNQYFITTVTDANGINSIPGTTDPMCANVAGVQVREAAITSSYKWVKGDVGTNVFESTGTTTPGATDPATCPDAFGGYTRYPCVAEVNPNGNFDYTFDIVNSGNISLTNYTFYDILPHIGDVGVNQALSTSGRLTQWTPVLTGPVTPQSTVPARANFTVLYSLSYDPCRPELASPTPGTNWQGAACTDPTGGTNVQNTWYTQAQIEAMAGTWANVKSFKILMYAGVTDPAAAWPAGTHMYFDAPMHAPINAPASSLPGMAGGLNLSAAWNSLGDQVSGINPTDGSLLPQLAAAPRKVGIIVPAKPQVQVGDYVWVDANKDGLQDATDVPIPGVVLVLTGPDGQPVTDVFGNVVPPQTTDATGHYLFPNLPLLAAGQSYTVTIDKTASAAALAGYVPTTANAGTNTSIDSSSWTASSTGLTVDGQKDLTLDFGFVVQPVSIGDYVWLDNNRDGLQTAGEPGVKDVTVTLKNASGTVVGTYTTGADGYYEFTNLTPGAAYTLTFTTPTGYSWTTQNVGGDTSNSTATDTKDSDVNPADGTIAFTAPTTGTNGSGAPDATDNPTLDGGLVQINLQLAKTGGTWSGLLVPGTQVTWTLTPNNAGASDALTGWSVTDVLPAGLEIVSMSGTGYTCDIATAPTAPVCTAGSGLAAGATGAPITVVTKVAAGWAGSSFHNVAYVAPAAGDVVETNVLVVPTTTTDTAGTATDNDAQASINVVSVGDFVWVDANRDGLQETGEAPVVGATVTLYAANGTTVLATATTDSTGHYWFTGLTPSTAYVIGFDISTATSPAGATAFFTTPNAGSDTSNSATADVKDSDTVPATPTAQRATVSFTSQATGANAGGANVADNPGIDAGIVVYNLRLAKALTTAGPFVPGQTVTYTLTPHNDGPAAAVGGWSLTDVLPADLALVSMTGAGYDCATTAGTCVAAAALAAGVDGPVITVTAKLSATFAGVATNVAYVSPAGSDGPETNPLVVPTLGTDTAASPTDNDAQASLQVQKVSIGDYVWWDVNRDGLQGDPAVEKPVAGMTVNLYAADGTGAVLKSTTTDANGYYWFTDLLPGTHYTVEFVKSSTSDPAVAKASFTKQNAGADATNSATADLTDSDADLTTGRVTFTSPTSGSNIGAAGQADNHGIDAGLVLFNLTLKKTLDTAGPYYPGLTVTYTVTPHNDGPADALAGWSVTDVLPTGLTFVSMTAGTSYSCAANVCASSVPLAAKSDGAPVTVTATINAGFIGTANNVAYVSPAGTDVPETNPLGTPVVKDGDTSATPTDNDAQAPLTVVPVSIGDYVWWDINRDGLQGDPAVEKPVAGMTVQLKDATGTVVATKTTDANGYYAFTGLVPNTAYTVVFVKSSLPDTAAASFTTLGAGDVALDSNANPADGTAAVTTPTSGSNLGDPTKADDPTIDAGLVLFNLTLAKTLDTAGPYYPGLTVTYTLTPHNDGPADALAGWSVTDVLPTGLTFVSMTGAATYECAGNVCTSSVPLAAASDGAPVTVTATIDAGFIGTANNVAYVSPAGIDVPETNPLGTPVVKDGDTSATPTDNDAQAPLTVVPVSIGDYVWYDRNLDGQQGPFADEPVVADGMVVNLYAADGTTLQSTTTTGGYYAFTGLAPHTAYVVEFVKPADTVFTTALTGAAATDSNADVTTGRAKVTTPDTGANLGEPGKADDPTIDAGLVELVSIGDYVWYDRNRDGLQGAVADEPVVPGVTVNLLDADGKPAQLPGGAPVTTTTDANGFYSFTNLLAGVTYQVQFVKPADTVFTTQNVSGDSSNDPSTDATDSDADVATGLVTVVAPVTGANSATSPDNPSIDAGLVELVSVGNYVWLDVNRDGLQTAGEAPVAGVTVNLLDADGKPAVLPGGAPVTTVTDSNGYYAFNNLIGGVTYQIQFVTPANMVLTGQDVTGDTSNSTKTDTSDSDADPVSGQVTFVASLTGDNLVDPLKVDNPTLDAGLITLVSVGDYVWFDVNRNGTQDAGEPAVPGVVVNLYDTDGNKVATATTDGNGFYSFTDLLAGAAYSIEFVKPAGSSFTTALANPDTTLDSDADVVTGRVSFTAAADGDNRADTPDDPSIDAGLVKLNLTLTKQLSTTAAVHLGDQITFTLTPHNEGPVDALTGWSVTEVLPAGLTMVSMTGTGYECTAATCVASAALTAGADGPAITVVATVAAVGDLRNVAYITPSPKDVPETTPLGPVPTPGTDTDTTPTDNDAQASLVVPASRLAQTGAELQPLLILGLGLFLTGGLLILITRRRPRRAATQ